jgi:ketosteroid isomerase-like protein
MNIKHMDIAQAEVMAVLDTRVEACRAKDIDRLMSLYSPGIVYFDIIPRTASLAPAMSAGTSCGGSTNTRAVSGWRPMICTSP